MDIDQYLNRQNATISKKQRFSIPLNELYVFTRQFFTLLKAGISLFKSLEIIIVQTKNHKLKTVCDILKNELIEGSTLADAMKLFPNIFPDFFVSLIAVGETRGNLDDSFAKLAEYLDKKRELQNKIINAIIYPAILITLGIIVVSLMITVVLPKFMNLFMQNNMTLPLLTRLVIGTSNFIVAHFNLMLLVLCVGSIWSVIKYQTPEGKFLFDRVIIRIPFIGPIIYNIAIIRFARTLSILYGSGISLITSIEMARDIMGNHFLASYINYAIKSVKDGKGIAAPLSESGQFPPIMVEMLGTGEETGTLETLAMEAANFLDNETEYIIKRQIAFIEPVALIFIGLLTVIIVASFFLPIFKLISTIRH